MRYIGCRVGVMDLVVRNCRLVGIDGLTEAELGVEDGRIVRIAKVVEDNAEKQYDAKGRLVFPGVIDGHVHFNLKYGDFYTADDFLSGTAAAACGGVTTVIDFVTPESRDYVEEFRKRRAEADGRVLVDYGLHVSVIDYGADIVEGLSKLFKEGGIASVKIFTAYSRRGLMLDDGKLYRLMQLCRKHNVLVMAHCENEWLINMFTEEFLAEGKVEPIYHSWSRPDIVEAEAVQRLAYLSEVTGAESLVVHLSSKAGLDKILEARSRGTKIHCETCPHYLLFTEDVYREADGAKYIMSPPLKKKTDMESLWAGVVDRGISTVGSDHACFNLSNKLGHARFVDVPGGVAGTEVIAMVLFSEGVLKRGLRLERMVELTSYNPAVLYGLYPSKGLIRVGGDADFYILDPNQRMRLSRENLHSRIDHSVYENIEVDCRVVATFSRGELVAENGEIIAKPGRGKYLYRGRGRG